MDKQLVTDRYAIYEDDCIEGMSKLPDESIHFSIYSPPFATASGGLYHYSSSKRDLSNSIDYNRFMAHYNFVISEIYRLTKPGRSTAVHVMDTPLSNNGKADFLLDFPGEIYRAHVKCRDKNCIASDVERANGLCGHGWFGHTARHCIWKEPLGVRNRTMAKKLAHATIVSDSTRCGVAGADYLMIFRKKGTNQEPVTHPHGLLEYAGERQIPSDLLKYQGWQGNQIENRYSHWIWRQYASAFWDDIRIDNVLPHRECKDEHDEKHIHPLQLDVIERAITLYSNKNDIVLTPFMGVGSEVYGAVRNQRKAIGFELKENYFIQAVKNLQAVDVKTHQAESLFDLEQY